MVCSHRIPSLQGTETERAWDLLLANHQVTQAIRKGELQTLPQIQKAGKEEGMVHLDESLALLVAQGRIRREEAAYRAHEPTAFGV